MPLRNDWKRLTVNLEPALAELAKKRAKARRQSVAAYLATLLERDIIDADGAADTPVRLQPLPLRKDARLKNQASG